MRTILRYLGLGLSLAACQKEDAGVAIRVRNASPYAFEAIVVNPGSTGSAQQYGSLPAGQNSDYQMFARAYRYAYVKLSVRGQELVWQPIDFVGEQPLAPGRYTYVLGIDSTTSSVKRLSLQLANP